MRYGSLSIALITALLTAGATGSARAQEQNQPVPDAPQPQQNAPQQKKTAPDKPNQGQATPPASSKDDNPFPEATSQDAAKAAQTSNPKKSTADDNPFPDAVSKDAAKAAQKDDSKKPPALENPFPESQSRDAAKAAGNDADTTPAPRHDLPPGVSSSNQSGDLSDGDVVDPARAKKDSEVGNFYLKSGDYKGALQRYKDAMTADPTNVDAIFGLAETQRMLKNNAEAAKNYQTYLDIMPNGPKSKQALKALKALPAGK